MKKSFICAECGTQLEYGVLMDTDEYLAIEVYSCSCCAVLPQDRDDALTEKLYQLLDTPLKRAQFFYETGEHILSPYQ